MWSGKTQTRRATLVFANGIAPSAGTNLLSLVMSFFISFSLSGVVCHSPLFVFAPAAYTCCDDDVLSAFGSSHSWRGSKQNDGTSLA